MLPVVASSDSGLESQYNAVAEDPRDPYNDCTLYDVGDSSLDGG